MSDADSTLTMERLKELLSYCPNTGVFTWLNSPAVHKWRGQTAGRVDNGYVRIRIDWKEYLGHRLAWLYMTGSWPLAFIDHINGERSDNRWANLRDIPHSLNMQNLRRANRDAKSGLLGVKWDEASQRWKAKIVVDGVEIYLGRSKDKMIAAAMYVAAKRAVHKACTLDPVDM